MSTVKRCWWGDLRLWYHARTYTEGGKRTSMQKAQGIERQEVQIVGRSPNWDNKVTVYTFFAPTPEFTQEKYRAHIAAMLDALQERSGGIEPGRTLVWVKDHTAAVDVAGFGSGTVTTVGNHPFVDGDRVHVPSLGNGYAYGEVSSAGGNTFDLDILEGSRDPAISDKVYLVERAWPGHFCETFPELPAGGKGDYHNPKATYGFSGSRSGVYTRTVVDLGADLG